MNRNHGDQAGTAKSGRDADRRQPRLSQQPRQRRQRPNIKDLVKKDIDTRAIIGLLKYGKALKPHNGRDALRDAYEEALDLCQCLRQAIYGRDGR